MKKLILITCACNFLAFGFTHAQSFLGIYGGINSSKFSGDAPSDFKYAGSVGYIIGVSYDIRLQEDLFLSVAPAYANGPSKMQYPMEGADKQEFVDSISFKYQSINLPVFLKIVSDNQRFQFTGGLEYSMALKLTADDTAEEVDLIDDINKGNLSGIFGIGYRIPTNDNVLIINLTYSQGLTNLANNSNDQDSLLPRIRYSSLRLTAEWFFPVGKNKN